jgi:predicted neuraminidase
MIQEFIFEKAPFPSCHASTLVEADPGHIVAAWFGGADEGEPDVGIWSAHRKEGKWTPPVEVARHEGVPCWNPVLWKDKVSSDLILFYKAGPHPDVWTGFLKRSADSGESWSNAEKLPAGILGPVKNKPFQLEDGTLLCGSSVESWRAWGCWCEITKDGGRTWAKGSPINLKDNFHGLIQPTLFRSGPGSLRMLMRSRSNTGKICASTSHDEGKTWSDAVPTDLPNPDAGIDAVNLSDGRIVLVYNPTIRQGEDDRRSPLSLAVSSDGGESWKKVLDLENTPGWEFSYPAVIQTSDGMIATTYTWDRKRIRFAMFDPKGL